MLAQHSFEEKASDNLRLKLEAEAVWKSPCWKKPLLSFVLIVSLIMLSMAIFHYKADLGIDKPTQKEEPEEAPVIPPLEKIEFRPVQNIVERLPKTRKSLLFSYNEALEPEFNLYFADSPATFAETRHLYADLI